MISSRATYERNKPFQIKRDFQSANAPMGRADQSQASYSNGTSQLVAALLPAVNKWPVTSSGIASACVYCGKPGHFRKSCSLILGVNVLT